MINVGHLHHEQLLRRGRWEPRLLGGPMLHLEVSLLLAKLGKEVLIERRSIARVRQGVVREHSLLRCVELLNLGHIT